MGQDKALLRLQGETLAERGLRKLREVCPEVAIAGGVPELGRLARVVPDRHPGCGPLGGIVAALEQTHHEWNLFLPIDVPFLPVLALRALLFNSGGKSLVTVAQVKGRAHPLCGVYSRNALPALVGELDAGRRKVMEAIRAVQDYSFVQFEDEDWFHNLNTPEEFAMAEDLIGWQ